MNRKLNCNGVDKFHEFISELSEIPDLAVPTFLLDDPETSDVTGFEANFEQREFRSRQTCGFYVVETLAAVPQRLFLDDTGFWSGLALLWFDQLCPPDKSGKRNPKKDYNYILSSDYRHTSRHAIKTAWQLASIYGDRAGFLQERPMHVRGELIEQLMGRQEFLSCEGAMLTASRLYTDNSTGSLKKGAGARKSAGCIARYIIWLKQLEQTFDLYSLTEDDLYNLLPSEFARFKM